MTADAVQSTILLKDGVKEVVRAEGLVGKLRDYQVVNEALDQLNVPQFGDVVPQVTKSVKQAVTLQQTLETAHAATVGVGEKAALDAFAETSVKAESSVASVRTEVAALQKTVGKVDSQIGTVQEKVGSLDGKVTTTLGTTLQKLDSELKTVSGKVEVLKELDPSNVRTKLIEIEGLSNRISALEQT
jgi:chromosome segregation ATPase